MSPSTSMLSIEHRSVWPHRRMVLRTNREPNSLAGYGRTVTVLIVLFWALLGACAGLAQQPPQRARPVEQLRIYELDQPNSSHFRERFLTHGARIMARHGFQVERVWESRSPEKLEWVYLLSWPDEETMRRAWAAFLADEEWQEIKRQTTANHGRVVMSIQDRVLTPVGRQ